MTGPLVSFTRMIIFMVWMIMIHMVVSSPVGNPLRGGSTALQQQQLQNNYPKKQLVVSKFASESRMPSLFGVDDIRYDRYAACLAATEGLRRLRDQELLEEVVSSSRRRSDIEEREQHLQARQTEFRITEDYRRNCAKVLKALGMSVSVFNDLSKELNQDDRLKEKVMEQAYLYRMAASVNMDRLPLISPAEDEMNGKRNGGFQRENKIQLFCDSMTEIESLRSDQVERLKKSLHVQKDFPSDMISMSDPQLLPFLSPKVRAVVKAFPLQAEEVVKKHGLTTEEFNNMLQETRSNPLFRWKVQKTFQKQLTETDSGLSS